MRVNWISINFPKRLELSFRTVRALPKLSRIGLLCSTWASIELVAPAPTKPKKKPKKKHRKEGNSQTTEQIPDGSKGDAMENDEDLSRSEDRVTNKIEPPEVVDIVENEQNTTSDKTEGNADNMEAPKTGVTTAVGKEDEVPEVDGKEDEARKDKGSDEEEGQRSSGRVDKDVDDRNSTSIKAEKVVDKREESTNIATRPMDEEKDAAVVAGKEEQLASNEELTTREEGQEHATVDKESSVESAASNKIGDAIGDVVATKNAADRATDKDIKAGAVAKEAIRSEGRGNDDEKEETAKVANNVESVGNVALEKAEDGIDKGDMRTPDTSTALDRKEDAAGDAVAEQKGQFTVIEKLATENDGGATAVVEKVSTVDYAISNKDGDTIINAEATYRSVHGDKDTGVMQRADEAAKSENIEIEKEGEASRVADKGVADKDEDIKTRTFGMPYLARQKIRLTTAMVQRPVLVQQ
jgi:hypothetical protein